MNRTGMSRCSVVALPTKKSLSCAAALDVRGPTSDAVPRTETWPPVYGRVSGRNVRAGWRRSTCCVLFSTYRAIAPDDTLFAFVGGGPDQPRMKAMAEEMDLGPVVHFTGRIPDEQLWAYLSTADVCVDPDPFTEWSNMSTMNKIIEYMAFGRPIVAFDLTRKPALRRIRCRLRPGQ